MRVVFTPAARAELVEAQDWYEAKQSSLGTTFCEEVEATVFRLRGNPGQFSIVFRDVRRARLRKFPYGLFFRV